MANRLLRHSLPIGVPPALLACAVAVVQTGLPDHAKPRVGVTSSDPANPGDLIRYRTLSRADFKAGAPRADFAKHAHEIGAYTCGIFPPTIGHRIEASRDAAAGVWIARVVDAEYFAVMDRSCSWWNPSQSAMPADYVLQHEQIHFALVEIEARKILAQSRSLEVRAPSRAEATLAAQEQIDRIARQAPAALLEVNTRFDRDTSARYDPRRQAEWWAHVEAELRRLPASARPGPPDAPESSSAPPLEPL